jgi:transcriptional regulator with XRE-family HTH domain
VADAVIRYRAERGLSQTALARLLGWRQPVVARLEAAEHNPTMDTLLTLASTLGLRVQVDVGPKTGVVARLRSPGPPDIPPAKLRASVLWFQAAVRRQQALVAVSSRIKSNFGHSIVCLAKGLLGEPNGEPTTACAETYQATLSHCCGSKSRVRPHLVRWPHTFPS